MTKELGPRERFFALNGLVCLVQSMEGKTTTVDLRNESSIYGKIDDVDAFMNINMSDAVLISGCGKKYKFENYYVQARNVRYVHIPQEVKIIKSIERQLGNFLNPRRGRPSEESKKSFKARRAARKQQETIAMIEKMKEDRLKKEKSD
ncbi:U7 snRNA-associated Sm-like protein LSm10 [Macrosteles quadrilineatus]|uniref:U7 snRNA-associated Sm-like protein LSm10 n=1 Tax=Macrosteles quadrilineatus TaxID=74068 RepID=UPI0023E0BA47|nr:U7 snRNA-associated Sm-like protein LSm10 [Macrosteles quadrilineatus]